VVLRGLRKSSLVEEAAGDRTRRKKSSSPKRVKNKTKLLLGNIWGEFLETTGFSKHIGTNIADFSWTDTKGVLTAKEAKEAKLVDRIAYPDEIQDELKS
jgi:hypothetical protein